MKKKKRRSKIINLKETIICRCEEVTEQEILQTIRQGYHSLDELKRILRCGMGHCQGRTCLSMIARMIGREIGIPVEKLKLPTCRPPLKPVALSTLSEYREDLK